jgi:hypothetical protein
MSGGCIEHISINIDEINSEDNVTFSNNRTGVQRTSNSTSAVTIVVRSIVKVVARTKIIIITYTI